MGALDSFYIRGISRRLPIRASFLSIEDLRRLYRILAEKMGEAAARELDKLTRQEGQTNEEFSKLTEEMKASFKVVITIRGTSGEWVIGASDDIFKQETLPDSISDIEYNSASLFQNRYNKAPQNSAIVKIDFNRVKVFDLSSPANGPTPNRSEALVSGSHLTWVDGVYEQVRSFFHERATSCDWLHKDNVYDVLLLLAGFPLSFSWGHRVYQLLAEKIYAAPVALLVGLYALYLFRLLFNYARWIFPKIEGQNQRRGPLKHRVLLLTLMLGAISAMIYDFCKNVFFN